MAVVIVNESVTTYSINGIIYLKNFQSLITGDYIRIVNVYDSKLEILPSTIYTDFTVDGAPFASAALLQAALVEVLFYRASAGAGVGDMLKIDYGGGDATSVRNADRLGEVLPSGYRRKVDSIASLKALTDTTVGVVVETDSYYGNNDGGGNIFSCVSLTTGTYVDNGGTVIVATDGRVYEAFNQDRGTLEQFGFKNDDTYADSQIFIKATAELSVVDLLPLKNYILYNKYTTASSDRHFLDNVIINGNEATIETGVSVVTGSNFLEPRSNVTLNNMTIKSDKLSSNYGIYTGGGHFNMNFNNLKATGFVRDGILINADATFNNAPTVNFEDCSTYDNLRHGMNIEGGEIQINNHKSYDNGYAGIDIEAHGVGDILRVNINNYLTYSNTGQGIAISIQDRVVGAESAMININNHTDFESNQGLTCLYRDSDSYITFSNLNYNRNWISPIQLEDDSTDNTKIHNMVFNNVLINDWNRSKLSEGISAFRLIYSANIKFRNTSISNLTFKNTDPKVVGEESSLFLEHLSTFPKFDNIKLKNIIGGKEIRNDNTDIDNLQIDLLDFQNTFSINTSITHMSSCYKSDTNGVVFTINDSTTARKLAFAKIDTSYGASENIEISTNDINISFAGNSYLSDNNGNSITSITIDKYGYIELFQVTKNRWILIDNNNVISLPTIYNDTGTVLDLSNTGGTPYNMTTPSTATTYTTTNPVVMGNAVGKINAATEPVVTGATKIPGSTFLANTDMYMTVRTFDGTNVEFYFTSIT